MTGTAGLVVCHPHVIVEIACGTPPNRKSLLGLLAALDSTPVATQAELLQLIDARRLQGRGCGYVDINLLASALLADQVMIWTRDKHLESLALDLGRCFRPAH
jgi:hypothetical protein